ncbi:TPA: DUF551 domain-containing protein [Klebsiella pneumoniae]|jgi:hypothetical protein
MIISASEFVKGYCIRSGITESEFYATQVPMPDQTSPWGWAAVSNDPLLIKAHVDLYLSQQPEVSADNSKVIGTYTEANGRDYPIIALGLMKSEKKAQIFIGDEGPVTFLGAHIEPYQIVTSDECRMEAAPVVPDDVLDALQKVARIHLDLNDFDGDRRGIADCLCDAEEALIEVVNRRAAMLQELKKSAGTEAICRSDESVQVLHTKSPAQSDCCPAQNHVSPEQNGDTPAQSQGWIQVSEQMPPSRHEVLVGRWWGEKPRWCCKWATYIPGHPDAQSSGWLIPGASWTPTHWMPLPAAPQEVK